jgi:hypothetical protein
MASNTPNIGAPEWDAAQATPWLTNNRAFRIFDAFSAYTIAEDRDLTAPPGACADGARYLLPDAGVLGGAWLGHNSRLAIAKGANAANGWEFAIVEQEGVFVWLRDEGIGLRYDGGWNEVLDTISRLADLSDVSTAGLADGFVLKWDASNGLWYPAPDIQGITTPLEITSTNYDLPNSVAGLYLRFTSDGGKILNVRTQATHALTIGTEFHIRNASLQGNLTITPATGVLINPPVGGSLIIEPSGTVTLKSIHENELDLMGATLVLVSN